MSMDSSDSSLPLPLQPAPPLAHRESASSLASSSLRRAGSSSPVQGRDSPTSSNKRRRTGRLSPLDSLATTATDLLSTAAAPSSSFASAAPHPPLQGGIPLSTLVLGQPIQEQQQRELDRRRESASLASSAPASSSTLSGRRPSSAVAHQDAVSSLAKRRGHRPPAVATGSSAPSSSGAATHRGSFTAVPPHFGEPFAPPRSAPVDIPSVLVGSPMEASFAARAARDRGELPPIRTNGSGARETAPASRRQSQSAAAGGGGGGGVQPQPPLVSSSSYYIRPSQPLGPGVSFPLSSSSAAAPTTTSPRSGGGGGGKERDRLAAPQQPQTTRLPSLARATGSSRPHSQHGHGLPPHSAGMQGFHPHPLQAFPPPSAMGASYAGGPLSPLPPLSASIAAPGAPPVSMNSPSFSALPPHSAGLAAPPSSSAHPTHSASKQAFLALFSTFYDSLSDSRVLTASLDVQLARAAQLLATLQQAEASFDAAVGAVRAEGERRWRGVEERLARLEGAGAGGGGGAGAGVEERLARLERLLLERETAPEVRRASGDSASSGAVADSEASAPARRAGEARDAEMEGRRT
ncbi:hypothetical protein JCM10449v2_007698 [Rhodotorula kratochvilovae]